MKKISGLPKKRFFLSSAERVQRISKLVAVANNRKPGQWRFDLATSRARAEQALCAIGVQDAAIQKSVFRVMNQWTKSQIRLWKAWKQQSQAPHFVLPSELALWAHVNQSRLPRWKKAKQKPGEWIRLAEQTIQSNLLPATLTQLLGKKAPRFWKIVSRGTARERTARFFFGHEF